MDSRPFRPERVASLVCAILADVELTRIRMLSGGRRFDVDRRVPAVFKASAAHAPESAEHLLGWARAYRDVVDVFCEIRDGSGIVEHSARLRDTHRAFVASSLSVMEDCLTKP